MIVKFIFQWYSAGRYYITSPYKPKILQINGGIPCAAPVDITYALNAFNPVDAIAQVISGLTTGEDRYSFATDNFNWFIQQNREEVTVRSNRIVTSDLLYWQATESQGVIQLAKRDPLKLRIECFNLT
ncbi:hypothetical protein LOD99_6122 [Oopsacas minuta]|uniref:Uncharacterized protein n=1 Tax=Oopsacas minuta TaxID=111878 RepID=A0AAV7JMR2_9METZ|nr:hypothetical protein LOD99_6122 [Oopsacas minuta]